MPLALGPIEKVLKGFSGDVHTFKESACRRSTRSVLHNFKDEN